jgi:squalene monooxygenase
LLSFQVGNPSCFVGLLSFQVDNPSCFVGLILENCELPRANHGHVTLEDSSPILFYPISSTEIRCLVDVPGTKIPSISNGDMTKYLKTTVAPQVPIIRQVL